MFVNSCIYFFGPRRSHKIAKVFRLKNLNLQVRTFCNFQVRTYFLISSENLFRILSEKPFLISFENFFKINCFIQILFQIFFVTLAQDVCNFFLLFCDLKLKKQFKIHHVPIASMISGLLYPNLFFIRLITIRKTTQIIIDIPS